MNARPVTQEDFERIAAMLKADEERLLGRPSQIGPNDLREWFSRTDLANDSRLYEEDGEIVGVGWVDVAPDSDLVLAIGVTASGAKSRGIGTEILEWNEARAQGRANRMHVLALGQDAAAMELFHAHGYNEIRRFYDMAIEQTEPPAPVDVPVESVTEDDLRAFHAALDEAFQDHWEHHSTPFDEWWGRHASNPNLDLSLWFLIRDGEEIAAVTRNEGNRNGGGYIGAIGVRRPWRGKGYAKALLLHSFREFFERGMPRVTLGVDAQNPTGATHLYERVGMHVEMENVVFEKVLTD